MPVEGYAGVPKEVRQQVEREETINKGEILAPCKSFSQLFENHDSRLKEDWKERSEFLKNFSKVRDLKIYVDTKTVNDNKWIATYAVTILLYIILMLITYIAYTKRWFG